MSNVIAVYVPQAGMRNLRVGLDAGIWGFKEFLSPYREITPGDVILLGYGYSDGSPRVQLSHWLQHSIGGLVVGVVTTGIYEDDDPVWPDESEPDTSYLHRLRFEQRDTLESVPLGPSGPLGEEVSDALRLSAVNKGRGYVVNSPAGFTLQMPATPIDPAPAPLEADEPTEPASPAEVVDEFERQVRRAGLVLPPAMVLRFVCGLMAKPFVICTGLSGSGKTQLALALGRWIGSERVHVSAVRPDWTGAEALFGYENLLLPPSDDGRAAWSVPDELEFMLRAADDPLEPYLLVLDEMNLAHVERYFADVLSGMESGTGILPNLVRDDDGIWRTAPGGSGRLPFPKNLLVVGTVNVDETTYQFSPKVLDRSTSLEFRVETGALAAARPTPELIEPATVELRRTLIDPRLDNAAEVITAEVLKEVEDLHNRLAEHGREFGHRTYQEMLRYAALVAQARPRSTDAGIIDHLVVQKVLPRIHGSSRELGGVMAELAQFVSAGGGGDDDRPELPLAADKLRRMQAELDATHFTAF